MARLLGAIAFVWLPLAVFGQSPDDKNGDRVIYVPTPPAVVHKMLDLARVTRDDIVYDLGCGDGRIVCAAAKKFGASGVGIDIDPARIKDCAKTMKNLGVTADQVEIRQGDALKVKDLERADVVLLYMLPEFMEKLEPQVMKRLRVGTRIVAHDYPFPNLTADQMVEMDGPDGSHTLFVWTVKAGKK
jgi:precorrin-6B methylase 2